MKLEFDIDAVADEILQLAADLIAQNGWWNGKRGRHSGDLCELQAMDKAARMMSRYLGNDAVLYARNHAHGAMINANGIRHGIATHNDQLSSVEDVMLDFKRAREYLADDQGYR